jgi:uncharacterized protein (DUF433 family)
LKNKLPSEDLVGLGLYSLPEASMLTQISSAKIARWFNGYAGKTEKAYKPLWTSSFHGLSEQLVLTFRDLTELRVAQSLLSHGISPQSVRQAIQKAKYILGDERPLSSAKFRTDGRAIFLEIADEENVDEREQLLDILKSQYAFTRIVGPSLKDVDYKDYIPSRWWILGRDKGIVLDPARSFGRPIDAESSVPTKVLFNAFSGMANVNAVAKAYGVAPTAVRRSIEFERQLAA